MNWSCSDIEGRLSAYYDGQLAAEEGILVEKHVGTCSDCAATLASFRELSRSLEAMTEPDPFFVTRFRARRDSLSVAPWWTWRQLALRLLPVAAAAVAAAVAAVWLTVNGSIDLGEFEHEALGSPAVVDSQLLGADELTAAVIGIAIEPEP